MSLEFMPGTMNFSIGNGLCIYKGSTWKLYVTANCVENDSVIPADLTGFTGVCNIKNSAKDTEIIAAPHIVIEDAKEGIFSLNLTDEETLSIPANGESYDDVAEYQYDVYFEDTDGNSYRALQGFIDVSPNITNGDRA